MATSTQVWETYEKVIADVIQEAKAALEEEDGQEHG